MEEWTPSVTLDEENGVLVLEEAKGIGPDRDKIVNQIDGWILVEDCNSLKPWYVHWYCPKLVKNEIHAAYSSTEVLEARGTNVCLCGEPVPDLLLFAGKLMG
jgi:hypothetical protein